MTASASPHCHHHCNNIDKEITKIYWHGIQSAVLNMALGVIVKAADRNKCHFLHVMLIVDSAGLHVIVKRNVAYLSPEP